jgi:radical SAM protein with 4Fe4S-binding SPASM domain
MTTTRQVHTASAVDLLQRLSQRSGFPTSAVVHFTRRCNLRCVHCFQVDRVGQELTIEEWSLVLRRLADAGVLLLTVTGGEPSVRPDLLEFIRRARAESFAVRLKTNGVLLDEAQCAAISAAAVVEVQISVYSADTGRHDAVTGLSGSHARTLATAARLHRGGTRITLVCPIMRDTFGGFDGLADLALERGYGFRIDPGIRIREDGSCEPAGYRLQEPELSRLLQDRRVWPRQAMRPSREELLPRRVCNAASGTLSVAANGDVWPCQRLPVALGNLLMAPLRNFWQENALRERVAGIRWMDLPACRKCEFLPFCGRCHAEALREDGDLFGPSRMACIAAQVRARVWAAEHSSGLAVAGESRRLASAGTAEGAAEGSEASTGH